MLYLFCLGILKSFFFPGCRGGKVFLIFFVELNYLKLNILNPVSRMQAWSRTHLFLSILNPSMSPWLLKYCLVKKNTKSFKN